MAKKVLALADDGYGKLCKDPESSAFVGQEELTEYEKAMDWFRGIITEQEKNLE